MKMRYKDHLLRILKKSIFTEDGCRIWIGSLDECGYGRTTFDRKLQRTHRVMWEYFNGKIPNNMVICHKCDTPACINLNHLVLGTQKDNVKDMLIKRRANKAKGIRVNTCKLKENDIDIIRNMYANNISQYRIADLFNVSRQTIGAIIKGISWKHLKT